MKKLVSLLCTILMVVSLVGCQSTIEQNQDAIITERFPVNLNEVLNNAYSRSENKGTLYKFEKEDILEQYIIYNEEEDSFHIVIIVSDELIGSNAERINDFSYGNPASIETFYDCYERALIDYLNENNIDEDIYLDVYNESGEYKSIGRTIYY